MTTNTVHPQSPAPGKDQGAGSAAERDALQIRIAELTGTSESLAQTIAIAEGQLARLEKELSDLRRQARQAETELEVQSALNTRKRHENHLLDTEVKKNTAAINGQEERLVNLAESVAFAENDSVNAIAACRAETDAKLKAMVQEFAAEAARLDAELADRRNQTDAQLRALDAEVDTARKSHQRELDAEIQAARSNAQESVAKLLQDGAAKHETLMKATEATAIEVQRDAETKARRFLAEAHQRAAGMVREAQIEAEEVRRQTHQAEVEFLKEKNLRMADVQSSVAAAKDEAEKLVAAATAEAAALKFRGEQEVEERIAAANSRISRTRKESEREHQKLVETTRAELTKAVEDQEDLLAQKLKDAEDHITRELQFAQDEARGIVASARERAQAVIDVSNQEKSFKTEELKSVEKAISQAARQSAAALMLEAESTALRIVEEARDRAGTVGKTVDAIMAQAAAEAARIKARADAYFQQVKDEVPDPEEWDEALEDVRRQERDRLPGLLEPMVKNYLAAIDMVISDALSKLPLKFQTNKAIIDLVEAIGAIQHKKDLVKFGDLISKATSLAAPGGSLSLPPLKKSS